jgi:outer membrane protein assembly factor BamD
MPITKLAIRRKPLLRWIDLSSCTRLALLGLYEVHVARYYYSRGAYVAAINRAQTALTEYRDVPATEEALFILYRSYDALGMAQLRDDTKRIFVNTYPKSEYLSQGFKSTSSPWWKLW